MKVREFALFFCRCEGVFILCVVCDLCIVCMCVRVTVFGSLRSYIIKVCYYIKSYFC